MRLIGLTVILAVSLFAAPLAAEAQAGKVWRIGVLDYGSVSAAPHLSPASRDWQAFRERLRELGYVEGENIAFEYRWAEGRIERLPDLAAELVRLKVDIIATGSTPAALAAKDATKAIPIVFRATGDPVRFGLVPNLARPGGNVTGVSLMTTELAGKRLELLREIAPGASRFAILWDQPNINATLVMKDTEAAARALGLPLQVVAVRNANELSGAFAAMRRERASALVVTPSAWFLTERKRLADLALENALPTVFPSRDYVGAGGLMAYGANLSEESRRAAVYVAKILKGARPADLPVDQPTKFELVINMKTAKALGLTIPQTLLLRADEIIQ